MKHITSRTAAAVAGAAALALLTTACGGGGGGKNDSTRVSEAPARATSSHAAAPAPYVLNQVGEEAAQHGGHAERRPKTLVLSEFTSIDGVNWQRWGADGATGTGKVTGTWCLETCQDKPLTGTVTLSDAKKVGEKTYYSSFTLKLAKDSKKYDTEDLKGKQSLHTP